MDGNLLVLYNKYIEKIVTSQKCSILGVGVVSIQLGFLMNLKRCIGCRGCEMACTNENRLGEVHRRTVSKIDNKETENVFLSMSCNHCANPACIAVCPNHCFKKRRDGIVIHNHKDCVGCKSCIGACPFNAPKFNPINNKIDKCNMCVERLDKGLKPACVAACISEALQSVNIVDDKKGISQEWIPGIKMAKFTNPSVTFIPPMKVKCYWRK